MKCNKKKLHRLIDRQLCGEEKKEVEEHINGCSGCRSFVDETRDALSIIATDRRQSPPDGLFSLIIKRSRRESVIRLPLKVAAAGAAAAVVFFALLNVFTPGGANAEVEYYIEEQMDTLFGQALEEEILYEYEWDRGLEEIYFEEEI